MCSGPHLNKQHVVPGEGRWPLCSNPAERERNRTCYSAGALMALKHFLDSQTSPRRTNATQGRGGRFVSLQRVPARRHSDTQSPDVASHLTLALGSSWGPRRNARLHRCWAMARARGSVARVRTASLQCLQLRRAASTTRRVE